MFFATGDSNNQVFMEGYGVSNQCTALVRHNCLVPTKDAPELGFIRESSNEQYVPDVYYKVRNSESYRVSTVLEYLENYFNRAFLTVMEIRELSNKNWKVEKS